MKKIRTCNGGFTLVELLLYLALTTIMLAVLSGIGMNVLSSRVKARAQEELNYNAHFSVEKIRASIERAASIVSPLQGATSSALTLRMEDSLKDPTVFDVSDGMLRIQEGTDAPHYLTSGETVVANLEFANLTPTDAPGSVFFSLQLEAYNPQNRQDFSASLLLQTAVSLKFTP